MFEVIRLYGGRPYALAEHLARMERSAAVCASRSISTRCARTPSGCWRDAPGDALLRILVTRGGRRISLLEAVPAVPATLSLAPVTYAPTRLLDAIKSLSYASNMLASRLAREQGADDALLVTPHGRVLECPTSSFFLVRDGELWTAPLSDHVLDSITRRVVLAVAPVRAEPIALEDLADAQEAFVASSVHEVAGVDRVGEHRFEAPGPRTRELAALVRERIDCRAALMRIATVLGNRPQFVKAAAVSARLREHHEELLIHTGQHHDAELSAVFFEELGVPAPDHRPRRSPAASNASQLARMLGALDPLLAELAPDAVLALRRHQLHPRRRARRRRSRIAADPRRGGDALVRPRPARGAQSRADRPALGAAAVLERRRRRRNWRRGRARAAPWSSAM